MIKSDDVARTYIEKRFPRASRGEREKVIRDWLTKDVQSAGIAADFERRVRPLAGLRVLDAGSGNGGIGIAFAARGAFVEGVDIEQELVDIARNEAGRAGSTAHFSYYEGTRLPFEDGSFDAALSVSVIEHVENPVRYFSEVLRVLKPEGVLYLAFPNKLAPKETHTGLWGLSYLPLSIARLYVRFAGRNPIEDNCLHFYTYWHVRRLLRAARSGNRAWSIEEEKGSTSNPLKKVCKTVLRTISVPHQAFLPHVMLIVRAS